MNADTEKANPVFHVEHAEHTEADEWGMRLVHAWLRASQLEDFDLFDPKEGAVAFQPPRSLAIARELMNTKTQ